MQRGCALHLREIATEYRYIDIYYRLSNLLTAENKYVKLISVSSYSAENEVYLYEI